MLIDKSVQKSDLLNKHFFVANFQDVFEKTQ